MRASANAKTNGKRRLPLAPPSVLPPLYARWMGELLDRPLPREREATCDDCAMLPAEGEAHDPRVHFDAVAKCCSYLPELPSFLVGGILAGEDGHGRRTVEARIDARIGVSPLGLSIPPVYQAQYDLLGETGFGHTRSLRCPHQLDGGLCGIWLHRNAVCATWYCKHERGALGAELWREGIEKLLASVEDAVAAHCMAELGVDPRGLSAMKPSRKRPSQGMILDRVDDAKYALMWGSWVGRERELYARAAEIAGALSFHDVLAIAGPQTRLRAANAKRLVREHASKALPKRLRVGDLKTIAPGATTFRAGGYSPYDPIELPTELLGVLHRFDGRPTSVVRAQIAKEDGFDLDVEFLRLLCDFEILVPSGG